MSNREFDPVNRNEKSDFFTGLFTTVITSVLAAVLTVSYLFHNHPIADPFGTYQGHFAIREPVSGEEIKLAYEFKVGKKVEE